MATSAQDWFSDEVWGLSGTPFAIGTNPTTAPQQPQAQPWQPGSTPGSTPGINAPAQPMPMPSQQLPVGLTQPVLPQTSQGQAAQNPYALQMSQQVLPQVQGSTAPAPMNTLATGLPWLLNPGQWPNMQAPSAVQPIQRTAPSYSGSSSGSSSPVGSIGDTSAPAVGATVSGPAGTVGPNGMTANTSTAVSPATASAISGIVGTVAGPVGALAAQQAIAALNSNVAPTNANNAAVASGFNQSIADAQANNTQASMTSHDTAAQNAVNSAVAAEAAAASDAASDSPVGNMGVSSTEGNSSSEGDSSSDSGSDGSEGSSNGGSGGSGGSDGGSDGGGYFKGGYVDKRTLKGPNPKGPDDGFAALQGGEVVIPKWLVQQMGKDYWLNLIKNGKKSRK